MGILDDIDNAVNSLKNGTNSSAPASNNPTPPAGTSILSQILNELQIQNSKGQNWLYITDLTLLDYTVTTPAAAMAAPVFSFVTPPQGILLDTAAIGWDNNAASYYKYLITVEGLNQSNTNFVGFPNFTSEFDIVAGQKIALPPNARVIVYAYNYNGATSSTPAHVEFYMLGFLQS